MSFKPMKLRDYQELIRQHGWSLEKSGAGDWTLFNENGGKEVPFIKLKHPGPKEISAYSVKKTLEALKEAGKDIDNAT